MIFNRKIIPFITHIFSNILLAILIHCQKCTEKCDLILSLLWDSSTGIETRGFCYWPFISFSLWPESSGFVLGTTLSTLDTVYWNSSEDTSGHGEGILPRPGNQATSKVLGPKFQLWANPGISIIHEPLVDGFLFSLNSELMIQRVNLNLPEAILPTWGTRIRWGEWNWPMELL